MKIQDSKYFLVPKIGMRSVKTVIAVFICCIIDYFRSVTPIQSVIASILCIQPDTKNSVHVALTRAVGTLLGGAAGVLVLLLFQKIAIPLQSIPFYGILCLFLIPLIYISVKLGWPDATALTCIVYVVIVIGYEGDIPPLQIAVNRILDTLLGILVALPVNVILPNRQMKFVDSMSSSETDKLETDKLKSDKLETDKLDTDKPESVKPESVKPEPKNIESGESTQNNK